MSLARNADIDHGQLIAGLSKVMTSIVHIVEQETTLVRAGRLREAAQLERAKTELAQQYYVLTGGLKSLQPQWPQSAHDGLDRLRRQHEEFRAMLQLNMTVLATAHAVSEGIMRGVSDELARKASPSTYGASGRASAPGAGALQPLTVSRIL